MSNPHPIPELSDTILARFWKKVDRRGPADCWLWSGTITRGIRGGSPYGIWQTPDGHHLRPHRLVYTLLVGPIPEGLTLDHVHGRCSSTLCVNPAHLEPVSQSENIKRYHQANPVTFCKNGHPREPHKRCKGCAILNLKLYNERHPDRAREIWRNQQQRKRDAERVAETEKAS